MPPLDHRHRARPFVEAEVVAVGRRVAVLPDRRAGGGIERLDHFPIADAVKQDGLAVGDDRSAQVRPTAFRHTTRGPPAGHFSLSGGPA